MNKKIIYSFQKMNTAIFHGKRNRKCAELALPCDDSEDELAFSDRTLQKKKKKNGSCGCQNFTVTNMVETF